MIRDEWKAFRFEGEVEQYTEFAEKQFGLDLSLGHDSDTADGLRIKLDEAERLGLDCSRVFNYYFHGIIVKDYFPDGGHTDCCPWYNNPKYETSKTS